MLSRCELKQLRRRPRHVLPRAARRSERRPAVSSTDNASTSDELLPRYPLLHESNYFDHEASGRKHARMLSNRVAREATWIDAVGQHEMNRHFRDGDSKRKRNNITRSNGTVVASASCDRPRRSQTRWYARRSAAERSHGSGTNCIGARRRPTLVVRVQGRVRGDIEHELAALQVAVEPHIQRQQW